ncbi:alcohol dehydrogenase catalytic domain-containing protein [bacterium LRH843]|nr:alcohol dehydrogenase catalytic domain-containing protein [bacterium LRH843]
MTTKMNALVYHGKEQVSYEEVEKPVVEQGEVLIQVKFAGICGSDMGVFAGKHPRATAPLIMGHELSGVVALTNDAGDVEVGDRVTINPLIRCGTCHPCLEGNSHVCRNLGLVGIDTDGGFAEFVKVSSEKVVKIPDELSLETASLIEPLAVTVHAVRKSEFKAGDNVVVIGGGPIGMLTAMTARLAGAQKVMIIEVSKNRQVFAREQGFTVIDALDNPTKKVLEYTNGRGADIVYEVAGVKQTALLSTELVKITGQVVIVSVFKEPVNVDLQGLNFRELSMIGVRVYTDKDYEAATDIIAKHPEIASIITHKLPLSEGRRGFEMMREATDAMKILLCP